jgi:hypothetical protein
MPDEPSREPSRHESASVGEVVEYVKTYAKQETLGPLKGAARWIGFGVGGAIALGLGLSLVLLGVLRWIQTEWPGFASGGSSWAPYLIVIGVCAVLMVLTGLRINKTYLTKQPKR